MRIKTFQLGELNSNCYLVETAPGRCIAVDIGGSPRILLEYMRMQRLKLTKILLTILVSLFLLTLILYVVNTDAGRDFDWRLLSI